MQSATSQDATENHNAPQVLPSDFSDAAFARRLRLVREAAGMTQQQLADAMAATGNKIHRSTIGKIESGDRPVTIGEAVQLAGIVGVPLADLATELPDEIWEKIAYSNRFKAQVRLRNLQHEAAQRHRLMEDARLLYEDTLRRIKRAERDLAALGGELPAVMPSGKDDQ